MGSERLRCEVVTHPAVFESYDRPFVVISRRPDPQYSDQYIALGITTNDISGSISISPDAWEVGSLPKKSYVMPRYPTVISERDVVSSVGALSKGFVDDAAKELAREIGALDAD